MQQEDDLRGLAKVMEFMRAISIIFIVVHFFILVNRILLC